ncbi:pyridoxamine 5'-phosphate oxidase [Marisediminicola senii]|uniref:pyridoxamine 5'-phosphate oxidase n=1 Tax=Marisediminicola senii TaxID=2711233 RepID=UPI0013EA4493|nr:pyridoxamine 5'-phosphate oxidase [Marisediminicola senii]
MDSLERHTDYGSIGIDEAALDDDPMVQFAAWLEQAEANDIYEPNAMVVGTGDPDGQPSSRTVLLKGLDGGFEFVSNYGSRKGIALAAESRVSLLFPWYSLQRQVIVAGTAQRATAEVSDRYFQHRPYGSRIAAVASEQSRPIGSRADLEARVAQLEAQYPDTGPTAVPRPDGWGAYLVVPHRIEFWQGRTSRLHDRIVYTRGDRGAGAAASTWTTERLQP